MRTGWTASFSGEEFRQSCKEKWQDAEPGQTLRQTFQPTEGLIGSDMGEKNRGRGQNHSTRPRSHHLGSWGFGGRNKIGLDCATFILKSQNEVIFFCSLN